MNYLLPCMWCLQVYQPLELLLLIAAICTVADTFVPSLISVSKVCTVACLAC